MMFSSLVARRRLTCGVGFISSVPPCGQPRPRALLADARRPWRAKQLERVSSGGIGWWCRRCHVVGRRDREPRAAETKPGKDRGLVTRPPGWDAGGGVGRGIVGHGHLRKTAFRCRPISHTSRGRARPEHRGFSVIRWNSSTAFTNFPLSHFKAADRAALECAHSLEPSAGAGPGAPLVLRQHRQPALNRGSAHREREFEKRRVVCTTAVFVPRWQSKVATVVACEFRHREPEDRRQLSPQPPQVAEPRLPGPNRVHKLPFDVEPQSGRVDLDLTLQVLDQQLGEDVGRVTRHRPFRVALKMMRKVAVHCSPCQPTMKTTENPMVTSCSRPLKFAVGSARSMRATRATRSHAIDWRPAASMISPAMNAYLSPGKMLSMYPPPSGISSTGR